MCWPFLLGSCRGLRPLGILPLSYRDALKGRNEGGLRPVGQGRPSALGKRFFALKERGAFHQSADTSTRTSDACDRIWRDELVPNVRPYPAR
jgi:hypothetical protein